SPRSRYRVNGFTSGQPPSFLGAAKTVVGMTGFEPATFRSQSGRATNLRHIPSAPATLLHAPNPSVEGFRAARDHPPPPASAARVKRNHPAGLRRPDSWPPIGWW